MKKMRKTKMRSKKNARKTKRIRGGAASAISKKRERNDNGVYNKSLAELRDEDPELNDLYGKVHAKGKELSKLRELMMSELPNKPIPVKGSSLVFNGQDPSNFYKHKEYTKFQNIEAEYSRLEQRIRDILQKRATLIKSKSFKQTPSENTGQNMLRGPGMWGRS